MKWLCKFNHKWDQDFASLRNVGAVLPSKHTFYAKTLQPRYVRICKRCGREEWSKEDQFGNIWFEEVHRWQVKQ